mgnify:CR=1 FL=1
MRAALAHAPARLHSSLAYVAVMASQFVSAYRWALLARAVGFRERRSGRICIYYLSAMYLNLFGPGTVAGDVGRVLLLAGKQARVGAERPSLRIASIGLVALVWISGNWGRWCCRATRCCGRCAGRRRRSCRSPSQRWLRGPRAWWPACCRARAAGACLVEHGTWRRTGTTTRLLGDLARMGRGRAAHLCQIVGADVHRARALGLELPWAFFFLIVPLVNIAGAAAMSACRASACARRAIWYYLSAESACRAKRRWPSGC